MGFKSELKELFSVEPPINGHQPESDKQRTYIGWCCNTDQKFWVHTPIEDAAFKAECPRCQEPYIIPKGLTKLITSEHHLEFRPADVKVKVKK